MCRTSVDCSAKKLEKGEPNVSYICSRYYRAPELIFGATDYTTQIGKNTHRRTRVHADYTTQIGKTDLCADHLRVGGGVSSPDGRRRRRADPNLAAAFGGGGSQQKAPFSHSKFVFCHQPTL